MLVRLAQRKVSSISVSSVATKLMTLGYFQWPLNITRLTDQQRLGINLLTGATVTIDELDAAVIAEVGRST